jgi:hypothetical protein
MFIHILDRKGKTVFAEDLPANPAAFLAAVKPFRKDLVVGVECMFAWYWLADLCAGEQIPFALGHALAMKHIHSGKSKSDRLDAGKLAALLRGGLFPLAYAYPRAKRQTRDLLRRRAAFVRDYHGAASANSLVTAGGDRWLRVWDLKAGKKSARWRLDGTPTGLAVSSDGRRAVVWEEDGTKVSLWALPDPKGK